MADQEYQDLLEKYKARLRDEFGETSQQKIKVTSREYSEFKKELYPAHYTFFEKSCNLSEKILNLKQDPTKAKIVQKDLDTCQLNCTPSGVLSFAVLAGLVIIVFGSLIAFAIPTLFGLPPLVFLVVITFMSGLLIIPVILKIPNFMASTWRMKASNQMV